jgi:hypothetical protein
MNHEIERRYFIERIVDFVGALEEPTSDLHISEDNRVLFRISGKPFEALAWINEEHDLICVTTRTVDMPSAKIEDAVNLLKSSMQICWDHCVAMAPVENRYDLSMALFIGGFSFEAFEAVVLNLVCCSDAIEEQLKQPGTPKKKKK